MLPLPLADLPLEQVAPLYRRDEFLGGSLKVAIIGLGMPGEGDPGAVMEVVVPHAVEAVAALLRGSDQADVLLLVLRYDEDGPRPGGGAGLPVDGNEDMFLRVVVDRVGRVQPQAVEVVFRDPVARVDREILADRPALRSIEVDRVTPVIAGAGLCR